MKNFQPFHIRHVALHEPITALSAPAGVQGLYVVFWWHEVPYGHRLIQSAALPMTPAQVAQVAASTIAPAVGDALLEGFGAQSLVRKQIPAQPPSFSTVKALDDPLQSLSERIEDVKVLTDVEAISVIVCTRDRSESLARCLESLQRLTLAPQEIIVVDNAPRTDATRLLVEQMGGVTYVLEPRPGLSVARNTGLRHAKSPLVAFTDDDVVVHSDWTLHLCR